MRSSIVVRRGRFARFNVLSLVQFFEHPAEAGFSARLECKMLLERVDPVLIERGRLSRAFAVGGKRVCVVAIDDDEAKLRVERRRVAILGAILLQSIDNISRHARLQHRPK